jgi:hypothetical protein
MPNSGVRCHAAALQSLVIAGARDRLARAEEPVVRRLCAGGNWIRTICPTNSAMLSRPMGNDSLLAFFEIPKDKEPAGNRNAIGAMQHCAFVVTAARFSEVEARLKSHGIDYIGPIA